MKRIFIFLLTFTVWGAEAQERFDQIERRNPWNASPNAAGIRQDSLSRSYAEVYFTKENGGMMHHSSSDDSWNAGARTASIRHLKKISFAGGFGYDYFDGRNMCGSMFVRPGFYPVDILEFTPGRKIRETYTFTGGLSAELGTHWRGGLKADFTAWNYAKRKDLRHKNTALDFEFAPGVMYHAGRFAAGAAYIIGRNSEKIEAEEVGTTPESYKAFFDRGLRFGSLELWQSNDLHLTTAGTEGFPISENVQGASVQLQYGKFYVDAAYRNRVGKSGQRGVLWHDFETSQLTAHAVVTLRSPSYDHYIRLNLDWQSLDNRENILTYINDNGVSLPVILGSTPTFGRKGLDLGGEYEISSQRLDVRFGALYSRLERQSTLMFPYVKTQELHFTQVFARGVFTFGKWQLLAAADFRAGGYNDGDTRLDTGLTPGDHPVRLTDYYDYENEYLTAHRIGVELGLRRNIQKFYVDLSARYEHGFDLVYVPQANRVRATLSVGYNF